MTDHQHDDLSPSLARAASLLREPPAVRDEWRADLLRRVATQRPGAASRGDGWRVRPAWAIAACAAFVMLGALTTYSVMRDRRVAPAVAERPAAGTMPVRFSVVAPGALHVAVVGDFDQWNPPGIPLHRLADGRTWEVEIGLAPGRYTYAFVVDGKLARDSTAAEAPDDYGVPNSVLLVSGL